MHHFRTHNNWQISILIEFELTRLTRHCGRVHKSNNCIPYLYANYFHSNLIRFFFFVLPGIWIRIRIHFILFAAFCRITNRNSHSQAASRDGEDETKTQQANEKLIMFDLKLLWWELNYLLYIQWLSIDLQNNWEMYILIV